MNVARIVVGIKNLLVQPTLLELHLLTSSTSAPRMANMKKPFEYDRRAVAHRFHASIARCLIYSELHDTNLEHD